MTNQIKKTLFFYFIIKIDDSLNIISKSKETYFNKLKLNYFGHIEKEIKDKDEFLNILLQKINDQFSNEFSSIQKFNIDETLIEDINPNYRGKEIAFNLSRNENSVSVDSVEYNNSIFLL